MKVRSIAAAASLVLCLSVTPLVIAASTHHEVDPVHAWAIFKVKHAGASWAYGRFNAISGTVDVDDAALDKSAVSITIKADSIDTGNEGRDQHLKGDTFFDVKQFPTITFKSTKIAKEGDAFSVTGDLALHGTTKSITLKVEKTGEAEFPKGTHRVGFETTLSIKRSDYGMNKMLEGVGDNVTLMLSLEAIKK